MKNDKVKYLLCCLFFVILAAITFRCVFGENMVFSASDLNFGRLAAMKNGLPGSFTGGFHAKPVLGGRGYNTPGLFNIVLSLLPLDFFANTFYGMILILSSLSLVWFLRIWNRSWLASVFGALVAFWFNSIMLAAGGHAYKMEVLAFTALSLCFVEKAIRGESNRRAAGYSMLTGICVGIMMIEQQDVAMIDGAFVGFYTLFRLTQLHRKAVVRWLAILMPIAIVSLLLSGKIVLNSYQRNIAGEASVQSGGEQKWDFITQWSMVPGEWPDFIASGWGGWASNDPKGPYWGKIGRSPGWESTGQGFRNFKITSKYLGIIPFLFGVFGMMSAIRKRKSEDGATVLYWSVAGLIGFWLAFGKYSLLYKLCYHLPLISDIRDQSKFLDIFQVCLGIVSAYGLDRLMASSAKVGGEKRPVKYFWIGSAICAGLMLLAGMKYLMYPDGKMAEFSKMGFRQYAQIMVQNMSHAWLHAGLLALICAVLVFAVWKGALKQRKWVALAFVGVLAIDSVILTSHYFKADDVSSIKRGNDVINFLEANQGNDRIYFVDNSGIYNQWLASDGVYHRLNLFNIWQMPRMPVDYKKFLGTVGRNQIRLWELSSVKYVAAPASIMQQLKKNPKLAKMFKPVFNYQVPTARGMRPDVLLEFLAYIPRFALFQNWESVPVDKQCETLVSPSHDPRTTVLVDASVEPADHSGATDFHPLNATVTQKSATLKVDATVPSIVRFSQRYQQGWSVFVDGKTAKLLRVDYLCMGVAVPPGAHTVEFKCDSGAGKLIFMALVCIGSIVASAFLLRKGRRGEQTGNS